MEGEEEEEEEGEKCEEEKEKRMGRGGQCRQVTTGQLPRCPVVKYTPCCSS